MIGNCRLCLESNIELRDSHLLAAAFYKHMTYSGGHIQVTPKKEHTSNKQVSDYLLCNDCENKFNTNGENWVSMNYCKKIGSFPIQKALFEATPICEQTNGKYYNGDLVKGIDLNKLAYFAISVFWRAGAHQWNFHDHTNKLVFGKYEEYLRLYLLGEAKFPNEAALQIFISPSEIPKLWISSPAKSFKTSFSGFGFCLNGIVFALSLGNRIKNEIRKDCAINSRILVLTDLADQLAMQEIKKLADKRSQFRLSAQKHSQNS